MARTAWAHRHEFVHHGLPVRKRSPSAWPPTGGRSSSRTWPTTPGAAPPETAPRSSASWCVSGRARPWSPASGTRMPSRRAFGRAWAARVTLAVGGKVDDRHGAPLTVTGTVRTLSDGRFVHKGPMLRGLPGRLGPTAVLDVDGVKVILISLRWQTLDPEMLRFVGIEPTEEKIVVVKSTIHYRAAFEPIAHEIVEVDAPGLSSSNLGRFAFTRIRRPIFPLDPGRHLPAGVTCVTDLRTPRLRLRPFTEGDAPAHLALYQDRRGHPPARRGAVPRRPDRRALPTGDRQVRPPLGREGLRRVRGRGARDRTLPRPVRPQPHRRAGGGRGPVRSGAAPPGDAVSPPRPQGRRWPTASSRRGCDGSSP